MLRAHIELVPFGMERRTMPLGHLTVGNDGTGTREVGNYHAVVSWTDPESGDLVERRVSVQCHPRHRGPWHLVAKVLQEAIGAEMEGGDGRGE